MRKKNSRLAAFGLALCILFSLFAGCGKQGNDSDVKVGNTEIGENSGGYTELNVGYTTGWESLTPFAPNVGRNAPFAHLLYESLAIIDSEHELQPWVAKSWNTDDNGFTYDIEIWDTVKDSEGNSITAADIVWFLNQSIESGLKPIFAKIESVEQTGDYTFSIKLTSNIVGTIETILVDTYIVSQKAYEDSKDGFATTVTSSSPYICSGFEAGATLTLEKREDYWQAIDKMPECVQANVDKITFHIIPEAAQMGIALETGTIDIAMDMSASTGMQFLNNDDFTVEITDDTQGYQMFFSGAETSPCAEDVKLRQAICYAIDTEGLAIGLCDGYATQMYDVCSTTVVGFNEKWKNEAYYGYDPEKAKELLEESGYNGETLKILAGPFGILPKAAEMIMNYLMAVGINCEILTADSALFSSIRLDGTQYDILLHSIGAVYLPDHWSIRYDSAAYSTGDATSRHDEVLSQLLYDAWTLDGWNEENIDKVHDYLKDNAIAYGFINPQKFTVWNKDIQLKQEVKEIAGYIAPAASKYEGR